MLDQQLDELFGQHLDNSRYEERECKILTELYVSYLLEFARWHSGISADDSTNPLTEELSTTPELCESDGQLDLNVVDKLLTWHAESVGRMIELTLAESFSKGYVKTALKTSLAQFSSYKLKAEPSLKPMTVIKTADMTMHLWQQYVTTVIVPLAAASVNIQREMSIFNNHILVRIKNNINSVAQKALE
ncbi:hypothetical protein PtB15_6B519 [Puccinia triticina]|nr:hypothetical protein PtB15_6B519 [Puccinia triticina]